MRWDRKFRLLVFKLLTALGKPWFWLIYGLAKLVSKIWFGLRVAHLVVSQVEVKFPKWKLKLRLKEGAVVGLMVLLGGLGYWLLHDLPKPSQLLTRQQMLTTKIYDRNGVLLYKLYKNQNRSIVPLSSLPRHVILATLAIEDAEFYQHPGFSIRGIIRAARHNTQNGKLHGGSTITQQLVKNTLLSSEKTLVRKIREFVLSIEVEYFFTKDEILSMYLNEVGYGGTAYGIEEAANYYFGKAAKDLSLAEAALIAGLPASPTSYSPFGSRPDLAIVRQQMVIKRMVEEKMITREEAEAALAEPLKFALPTNDIMAPHFVMYVRELLVRQYGEAVVQSGGLEVITSLDYSVQKQAQEAVEAELTKLKGMNVTNAAVMVTNPKTGEILAMVGSRDYFDTATDGQVNVTLRPRQPGSSIKPITYALALEKGVIKASSLIDDSPITYKTPGSPAYSPQNYDGRFHGKVTVRQALANSYNVPAVKLLAQLGVSNLVEFGQKLGITTWNDSSRFGLSLTLGGGEITMLDMTQAYGAFANGGYRVALTPILQVNDYKGRKMDDFGCKKDCLSEQVMKAETAYTISDILADNKARSAAFGLNSVLVIKDHKVAVKTGTTNDLRDNWTLGFTPEVVVAVWVGNNDNSAMSRVASGITGASPIWQKVMMQMVEKNDKNQFVPPKSMVLVKICPLTQTLWCEACPKMSEEWFEKGTEPTKKCTAEEVEKATTTPKPEVDRDRLLDGITQERN